MLGYTLVDGNLYEDTLKHDTSVKNGVFKRYLGKVLHLSGINMSIAILLVSIIK